MTELEQLFKNRFNDLTPEQEDFVIESELEMWRANTQDEEF